MPSIAALRLAPWSLSKVKCALRCPQEFHFRYVDNIAELEVATEARLGKAVHKALEAALTGQPLPVALAVGRELLLLPEEQARYETMAPQVGRFGERIAAFRAAHHVHAELVEHRLAVRYDLGPTGFVDKDAFFRGVWDAGYLYDDGRLAIVDHKTGIRRPAAESADQLEGYATLAAAHQPAATRVWLGVHFVPDAAMEWSAPLDIAAVKARLAPRVANGIEQAAAALAGGAVTRVTSWCRRCGYRSICPAMRAGAPVPEWSASPVAEVREFEPEVEAETGAAPPVPDGAAGGEPA